MISSNSSECRFSNGKHLLWCYDTSYINNTQYIYHMKLIEKLIFAYSLFQTRHLQSQEQMWHTRWVPDFLFVKSRNIQCPNPCSDVLKNPFIMSIQVSNTRDISTCQSRLSCLNENSINFSMSPQYCEPCPGNFCLSHTVT